MKKEILFRGKRVNNGEWIEGYYVVTPENDNRIYWQPFPSATSNTYHEVNPETVGQFTGLTDKNGMKIFEGDIVKTFRGSFYLVEDMIEFYLWIERQFSRNTELSISGNIHDNPELL